MSHIYDNFFPASGGTTQSHVRAGLVMNKALILYSVPALSATAARVNASVKRTGLKDIN